LISWLNNDERAFLFSWKIFFDSYGRLIFIFDLFVLRVFDNYGYFHCYDIAESIMISDKISSRCFRVEAKLFRESPGVAAPAIIPQAKTFVGRITKLASHVTNARTPSPEHKRTSSLDLFDNQPSGKSFPHAS
jgi:hypothetical protein